MVGRMSKHVRRVASSQRKWEAGGCKRHRREHWLVDNQIYFITARCHEGLRVFEGENAKAVFWTCFDRHTAAQQAVPIITSLIDNHYHTLLYLKLGSKLPTLMKHLHGSASKLTNDLREAAGRPRLPHVWQAGLRDSYFDGCIRNATQFRRTYRYVKRQGVRHGLVHPGESYPHTRVRVALEPALKRALELDAFLPWSDKTRFAKRPNPPGERSSDRGTSGSR